MGSGDTEWLKITVIDYEREIVGEYYDDNWLNCYVELKFGGFTGSFEASFLTCEFILLLTQIEKRYDALEGKAKFDSVEQQLAFTLKGNGKKRLN